MTQRTTVSGRGGVVAALFHGHDQGEHALADLRTAGFTRVEISQAAGDDEARDSAPAAYDVAHERGPAPTVQSPNTRTATGSDPFFHEHDSSASSFVDELMKLGFSKHDAHDLGDGLIKGAALVTADAGNYLDRAVAIFNQYKGDVRYTAGTSQPHGTQAQINAEAATSLPTDEDADREIQLRAERLVVNKQRVQHGEARIRKEIVTEMKTIDVPVSHEELVIERHAVRDDGIVDSEPIAAETVRIPLTEENVTISKETVVRGEVEIGTRRVEDVMHVTDTVRHEELRVDDASVTQTAPKAPPKTL